MKIKLAKKIDTFLSTYSLSFDLYGIFYGKT